jgi:hypothetical protein
MVKALHRTGENGRVQERDRGVSKEAGEVEICVETGHANAVSGQGMSSINTAQLGEAKQRIHVKLNARIKRIAERNEIIGLNYTHRSRGVAPLSCEIKLVL